MFAVKFLRRGHLCTEDIKLVTAQYVLSTKGLGKNIKVSSRRPEVTVLTEKLIERLLGYPCKTCRNVKEGG